MIKRVLILFVLATMLIGLQAQQETVQATEATAALLRLHVVAASEALEDQQQKLLVRDIVLSYIEPKLQAASNQTEAEAVVLRNMAALQHLINEHLDQNGATYRAHLQYGYFAFPAKNYGAFHLPAGQYQALNIILDEGQGRNWWCVVFPPMCLTSAVCQTAEVVEDTTWILRFKLFDWWQSVWRWVRK